MRRLPSLADRVLAVLPAFETAPLAREVAARLNTDEPHVRLAFERLESEGRAKIVRRGRGLHLVPASYPGLICPVCRIEYVLPKKSRRITCSRSCGVKLSWRQPEARERRLAGVRASKKTPEASRIATETNNRRWARPGEREKMAEVNRKRWADPYQNARMAVAISEHHRQPEEREKTRLRIKARWDDEAGREKLVKGIRKSKQTPEARAQFSELLKERWKDPVWREKWASNSARARALAERNKGKKQSPEHVAKRVASFKRNKADAALSETEPSEGGK